MAMVKVLSVALMVLVPGGLLVLSAFVLARVLAAQMRLDVGPQPRRLARAVAAVRLRDVWTEARRVF